MAKRVQFKTTLSKGWRDAPDDLHAFLIFSAGAMAGLAGPDVEMRSLTAAGAVCHKWKVPIVIDLDDPLSMKRSDR